MYVGNIAISSENIWLMGNAKEVYFWLGMVVHTCSPSTGEAEAGSSRTVSTTQRDPVSTISYPNKRTVFLSEIGVLVFLQ